MEYWIGQAREYYLILLLVLYFTVGRLSLLAAVTFNIGSVTVCTSVILGIEFIQIPVFYNFYSGLIQIFSKIREKARLKKKTSEGELREDGAVKEKKEGFFVRRFGKYGIGGVFTLSLLPFKGCGVWSSLLLGKGLEVEKKKLYLVVTLGTVLGVFSILLFGFIFNKTAISIISGMNLNSSIQSLFQ